MMLPSLNFNACPLNEFLNQKIGALTDPNAHWANREVTARLVEAVARPTFALLDAAFHLVVTAAILLPAVTKITVEFAAKSVSVTQLQGPLKNLEKHLAKAPEMTALLTHARKAGGCAAQVFPAFFVGLAKPEMNRKVHQKLAGTTKGKATSVFGQAIQFLNNHKGIIAATAITGCSLVALYHYFPSLVAAMPTIPEGITTPPPPTPTPPAPPTTNIPDIVPPGLETSVVETPLVETPLTPPPSSPTHGGETSSPTFNWTSWIKSEADQWTSWMREKGSNGISWVRTEGPQYAQKGWESIQGCGTAEKENGSYALAQAKAGLSKVPPQYLKWGGGLTAGITASGFCYYVAQKFIPPSPPAPPKNEEENTEEETPPKIGTPQGDTPPPNSSNTQPPPPLIKTPPKEDNTSTREPPQNSSSKKKENTPPKKPSSSKNGGNKIRPSVRDLFSDPKQPKEEPSQDGNKTEPPPPPPFGAPPPPFGAPPPPGMNGLSSTDAAQPKLKPEEQQELRAIKQIAHPDCFCTVREASDADIGKKVRVCGRFQIGDQTLQGILSAKKTPLALKEFKPKTNDFKNHELEILIQFIYGSEEIGKILKQDDPTYKNNTGLIDSCLKKKFDKKDIFIKPFFFDENNEETVRQAWEEFFLGENSQAGYKNAVVDLLKKRRNDPTNNPEPDRQKKNKDAVPPPPPLANAGRGGGPPTGLEIDPAYLAQKKREREKKAKAAANTTTEDKEGST